MYVNNGTTNGSDNDDGESTIVYDLSHLDDLDQSDYESEDSRQYLHPPRVPPSIPFIPKIHDLNDDILSISLALLGGNGHFRYGPLVCKTFLRASKEIPHFKMITTAESVTSSVSCVKKYFKDEGYGSQQLKFFWDNAIRYGRVDVMRWALQQRFTGGTITPETQDAYRGKTGACTKAADYGQTLTLQWLKDIGLGTWNSYTCTVAALSGHLGTLQWLRDNGCDWNSDTCTYAAMKGHLHILQWARLNRCDWDEKTCAAAAKHGHLHILQWARQNGCDWNENTCALAAKNGHLYILQWARQNGCPWNEETCHQAAIFGHLDILKWARNNGCSWYTDTCGFAGVIGQHHILQWGIENGCDLHGFHSSGTGRWADAPRHRRDNYGNF